MDFLEEFDKRAQAAKNQEVNGLIMTVDTEGDTKETPRGRSNVPCDAEGSTMATDGRHG